MIICGCINIKGKDVPIEKLDIDELNKYIKEFEKKRESLIKQQNDCLSQIVC